MRRKGLCMFLREFPRNFLLFFVITNLFSAIPWICDGVEKQRNNEFVPHREPLPQQNYQNTGKLNLT
jgi:hypothetical protein